MSETTKPTLLVLPGDATPEEEAEFVEALAEEAERQKREASETSSPSSGAGDSTN